MKTWVWMVVAVVGGYLLYNSWFAPDETSDEETSAPLVLEVTPDPENDPEPATATKQQRLDLGEGGDAAPARPKEDPQVAALVADRAKAREAGETKRAQQLADRIVAEHPNCDAAR